MAPLDTLAYAGLTAAAEGGRLLVHPRHLLTDDLRRIIRDNKSDILAALAEAANDATNPAQALVQQDGFPAAEVQSLRRTITGPGPAMATGKLRQQWSPWDERRTCVECRNLSRDGRCLAAWRGELWGISRDYEPVRDILQRCAGYAPGPEDTDQREGRFAAFNRISHADDST